MTVRPGRRIGDALGRGVRAVIANPALCLAPLAQAAATLAAVVLTALAVLLPLGFAAVRTLRDTPWRAPFWRPDRLAKIAERLLASPLPLLGGLAALLVFGTLLVALASYLKAGTVAVLIAADRAPERASRDAFSVEDIGHVFHEAGRRLFWPFFWLINLYALVLTLFLAVILLPVGILVAGIVRGSQGATLAGVGLLIVAVPVLFLASVAARLVYVSSARAIVSAGVEALEGLGRGIGRLKETAGRSVGLYFLTILIGMGLGALVSMPRVFLTFFGQSREGSPLAFLPLLFVLVGIETAVAAIYDLAVTGSFVALWSEEIPASDPLPPVSFTPPAPLVAVVLLLALVRCAPVPPPVSPPRPTPPPAATPSPSVTPTPYATPAPPPFGEVREPRLDVGLALDRTAAALAAGDWLVRSGERVERRHGPLAFSSSPSASPALFVVQAGSYATREAGGKESARLGALLGATSDVVENAGRFAVRLGEPAERKAAEAFLSRVRREAVPDSFLVGASAVPVSQTLWVEEDGTRTEWSSPVEVAPANEPRPMPFGDAQYRGHLLVRATGRGTLHVVNRVFLEDYLKGVVPSEMGPRQFDEVEALKAQAVAARSYALRRKGDFAAEGYDLCATPRCQVYGGVAVEQQLSSRAVDETAGQVLLWKGRVAEGLFTSTCGGRTENAADVFPSYASADVPYLASVACFSETPVTLTAAGPAPKGPVTMLGARGLALLASLGKKPGAAGLLAVRNAARERLGLPPLKAPHPLWPASAYAEIVEAAGFGDIALLIEPLERESAPPKWPEKSRAAYALLLRFQLGNGTTLPTGRALKPEEAAGIWANLLARLGDFEDVDGRLVSSDRDGVTVKSTKGRATYRWHAERPLFLGGADAAAAVTSLVVYPGDRVRVFVRGPEAVGLLAAAPASAGTYDRESSWIHWTRRFTAGELAAKLRERDPSRGVTAVTKVAVLERGASGRAKTVRVSTDKGPLTLAGLEVRFSLGLPENLFTVAEGRDRDGAGVFTFYGRGWGHGVGLCQNGAFGMALAGHSSLEILARYYAGAVVGPAPEGAASAVPGALR